MKPDKGLSDLEVDALTTQVYRRKPSLAVWPIVFWVILFPAALFAQRFVSGILSIVKISSLVIAGLVFSLPVLLFERLVHLPAVNRPMKEMLAEHPPAR